MGNLSPSAGNRKFCLQCDDGSVLEFQTKDITVEARGESCVVPQVAGWHCPVCREIEYADLDSSTRVWNALETLGEKAKLRDAALLIHARKRFKLTQKQAAELTGADTTPLVAMSVAKPFPCAPSLICSRY